MQSNLNSFAPAESDKIPTRPEDVVTSRNSNRSSRQVPVNKQSPDKTKEGSTKSQPEAGVVYARVSSSRQLENGNLEDQVNRTVQFAMRQNIELIGSPIKDGAQTGTDFNRPAIRDVNKLVREGKITCLVVDDIDRIGREALETLNYIYMLREYGVTITTPQNGEVDVWETSGRTIACMKTLFADVENSARVRRIKQGLDESFINGNWWARFKKVPFGYKKDGGAWIEIDEEQAAIYRRTVDSFLNVSLNRPYSRIIEITNLGKHGISESQLPVLFRRPVYIGKPTINKTADEVVHGDKEPTVVIDPDLAIIDEATFEKVQEKIDEIHDKFSTNESETNDVGDFIDRFGIHSVVGASEHVELRCAEDGCNGKLIKYGRRETDGIGTHNYKCQNESCRKQRKWPNLKELFEMQRHNSDD